MLGVPTSKFEETGRAVVSAMTNAVGFCCASVRAVVNSGLPARHVMLQWPSPMTKYRLFWS